MSICLEIRDPLHELLEMVLSILHMLPRHYKDYMKIQGSLNDMYDITALCSSLLSYFISLSIVPFTLACYYDHLSVCL